MKNVGELLYPFSLIHSQLRFQSMKRTWFFKNHWCQKFFHCGRGNQPLYSPPHEKIQARRHLDFFIITQSGSADYQLLLSVYANIGSAPYNSITDPCSNCPPHKRILHEPGCCWFKQVNRQLRTPSVRQFRTKRMVALWQNWISFRSEKNPLLICAFAVL